MDFQTAGDRGGNVSYSKAGLRQAQITGHYNEVQIQNNVFYSVDGIFGGLAPIDNLNTAYASANYTGPSTTNVPACNSALFALWVASNNTLTVTKGANVDSTKLSGTTGRTAEKVLPYPDVVNGAALVGLIRVTAGTGTSFAYGTTNFNATNINTAFYDTARMPTIPLTS
jgi:hypothetical protein